MQFYPADAASNRTSERLRPDDVRFDNPNHRVWARAGNGRLVRSGWALGEGLSRPREGCGGLGSVCFPSQVVGERGQWAVGVIRLGVGGGSFGAERGLWEVQVRVQFS